MSIFENYSFCCVFNVIFKVVVVVVVVDDNNDD